MAAVRARPTDDFVKHAESINAAMSLALAENFDSFYLIMNSFALKCQLTQQGAKDALRYRKSHIAWAVKANTFREIDPHEAGQTVSSQLSTTYPDWAMRLSEADELGKKLYNGVRSNSGTVSLFRAITHAVNAGVSAASDAVPAHLSTPDPKSTLLWSGLRDEAINPEGGQSCRFRLPAIN